MLFPPPRIDPAGNPVNLRGGSPRTRSLPWAATRAEAVPTRSIAQKNLLPLFLLLLVGLMLLLLLVVLDLLLNLVL